MNNLNTSKSNIIVPLFLLSGLLGILSSIGGYGGHAIRGKQDTRLQRFHVKIVKILTTHDPKKMPGSAPLSRFKMREMNVTPHRHRFISQLIAHTNSRNNAAVSRSCKVITA